MGAKVQTENTKLSVPGAGQYEIPSKVSDRFGCAMQKTETVF